MFSVKISYHHQRRLAIHYRMEALLNDSWVASPAENPLLSAWSSLLWRWTLSTRDVFLNQICPVIPVLGGQAQEAVLSAVQMRNSQKFSVVSISASPPTAFLSMRPSGEHPKPALSVPLGSEVGGKSWGCAHPTLCSQNQPQFHEVQPSPARLNPKPQHPDPAALVHTALPSLHQGVFSDATIRPQTALFWF